MAQITYLDLDILGENQNIKGLEYCVSLEELILNNCYNYEVISNRNRYFSIK